MMDLVTPLYSIPLVALFLVLSWRVIAERRGQRFAYGDNDSLKVQAKIRAQANWSEYVPITLLMMVMAELQGASTGLVHVTGVTLLVGRILHGYGMSYVPKQFIYRQIGMLLTLIALVFGMGLNLIGHF